MNETWQPLTTSDYSGFEQNSVTIHTGKGDRVRWINCIVSIKKNGDKGYQDLTYTATNGEMIVKEGFTLYLYGGKIQRS